MPFCSKSVLSFGIDCIQKEISCLVKSSLFQGYFLLHHMGNLVGVKNFDRFLYEYVEHYKGQLVTSEVRRF